MPRLRSLLFVPGDRPDRMGKALGSGADALILDLEDSVAPDAKSTAREAVAAFLRRERTVPLYVRINPLDGGLTPADLELEGVSERPHASNLKEAREAVERDMIQKALRKHGGKIAPAAADLGISRPTLYELMDKLGMKRE